LLAVVLIYIINLRSFGWTLEMLLDPMEFVQAFLVAFVAALLAGLYPAWKIGNTPPAIAVRTE
jgi:putative ABC transport system permease protein